MAFHNLVDGSIKTVSGATLTTDRFGNSNSAYSFDGVNDTIYIGTTQFKPISMSCIVKNYGNINIGSILTFSDYLFGYNQFAIYVNNNILIISFYFTGGTPLSGDIIYGTMNTTDYYYCVLTYDSLNVFKFYVNGQYVGTTTSGNFTSGTSYLALGSNNNNSNYRFAGIIDEFQIFNRALSADEVKLLYDLQSQNYIYPTKKYEIPAIRNGLVFECKGDNNGATTYYDTSGNGNNGTGTNITNGRIGQIKTMSFNGSSSYITIPTVAFSNCSISFWCNFNVTNVNQILIQQDDENSTTQRRFTFAFHNPAQSIDFNFWDSTSTYKYIQFFNPVAGKWYHFTLTVSNTTGTLYADGKLIGTIAITGGIYTGLNDPIRVGVQKYYNSTLSYFNGRIPKVQIWNRVLSQSEIQQLYLQDKTQYIF